LHLEIKVKGGAVSSVERKGILQKNARMMAHKRMKVCLSDPSIPSRTQMGNMGT
jgi:hypothetical protein